MDARTVYALNKVMNFLDNVEAELEPLTKEARADMQSALYWAVSVYDSEGARVFLEWVQAPFTTVNLSKVLLCQNFPITGCFISATKTIEGVGVTIKAGVKTHSLQGLALEVVSDTYPDSEEF